MKRLRPSRVSAGRKICTVANARITRARIAFGGVGTKPWRSPEAEAELTDQPATQAAFVTCDAYQCGYCTSGQIMSAVALLKEPCGTEDADVKEFMSGNICRCGAYANIVAAIQQVRKRA